MSELMGKPVIRYTWSGLEDGPVLVLGNSLGATGAMWEPQLAALGKHFRVLSYEHRGHGGSPAPAGPYTVDDLGRDVLELLDSLELDRVSYCGLSLGGIVGMWLAATAPERISRLALCCTTAKFDSPAPWIERAETVRASGTASIAPTLMSRWFTPEYAGDLTPILEMVAATDDEGYASCCEGLATLNLVDLLPKISAPTLVIVGDRDPATPPADGAAIAAEIPGARLISVHGAHLANVEAADEVTPALVDHLAYRFDE
jgi:3-oxoadipate enol-lactonase